MNAYGTGQALKMIAIKPISTLLDGARHYEPGELFLCDKETAEILVDRKLAINLSELLETSVDAPDGLKLGFLSDDEIKNIVEA